MAFSHAPGCKSSHPYHSTSYPSLRLNSRPSLTSHHHKFNAEELAKKKLKINEAAEAGVVLQVTDVQRARRELDEDDQDEDGMPCGEASGDSYEVLLGNASEIGSYQVLLQSSRDAPGVLRVAPSINRHFVVAQFPPNTTCAATDGESIDGRQSSTMTVARPSRIVVPYTHVPQIQGLEARFKMPGAGSAPPPPRWWKEGVREVEKEEKDDGEKAKEKKRIAREGKKEKGKKEKKKKKRKHRASDEGFWKKEGKGKEEDTSSPEKKANKAHKQKKPSRRQSV